jgi:hypothetical protein
MLDDGNILEMGTYEELIENDGLFAKFVENYFQSSNQEEEYDAPAPTDPKKFASFKYKKYLLKRSTNIQINVSRPKQEKKLKKVEKKADDDEDDIGEKIIGKEKIQTGSVN